MTIQEYTAYLFRLMSKGISVSEAQKIIEKKYGKVKFY
jgi:hypothetical protein